MKKPKSANETKKKGKIQSKRIGKCQNWNYKKRLISWKFLAQL